MEISDNDIRTFQDTIQHHSKYDFSEYTINSLRRRLTKILQEYGSMQALLEQIRVDPEHLEQVVKRITVNTTELFRDPPVWRNIMYRLLPKYSGRPSIRIWHPGCSTGQEVYSMMIILHHMELMEKSQVYATDINADALITAEKGEYRYRFNKQYIENFNAVFCTGDRGEKECFSDHTMYMNVDATRDIIRMKKFLRRMPVWEKFDLVTDLEAFKGTFDIIICRNVIIYFNYELQNRVLKLLHEHLNHGGCLMLGMHESIIGPCSSLFRKEENIYYRKDKTM